MNQILAAVVVWILIAIGPGGTLLESSLLLHVLVELPLLVLIGVVLGRAGIRHGAPTIGRLDPFGVIGILIASFAIAFWMIPRWLDASVVNDSVAVAKYLTLPLFAGIPIGLSWSRLPIIARALVKLELLTMLLRLAWIYLASPIRLCNNYLLDAQVQLGVVFIAIAALLGSFWMWRLFFSAAPQPSH